MDKRSATAAEVRDFFKSPGHPVKVAELAKFKKDDPNGYKEVSKLVAEAT